MLDGAKERRGFIFNSYSVYRVLQISTQLADACFAKFITPGGLTLILVIILSCNYVCIKLYHQIPMPAFAAFPVFSIICFVFIVVMIPVAGNVHAKSSNFIRILKNTANLHAYNNNDDMPKYAILSCSPLKARFHIFFYFQCATIMTVVSFIIFYTVKATLIF